MMAIEVRHLSCERAGRTLFRGLSFAVQAGELLEVRGANGSGKSRLLRILAGITRDWSGQVERRVPALFLGHENGLNPKLTVHENLQWLASLYGASDAVIEEGSKTFAVARLAHRPCETLSVGQQRRVALSRLVFADARLWLLDEPTSSLDARSEARFRQRLATHLDAGGAAIVATHANRGEEAQAWQPSASSTSRQVIELGASA